MGNDADGTSRRPGRGAARHGRTERSTTDARGRLDEAHVDGPGDREPGRRAPPRCGRSTTPPPTPTRCTSTRSSSRWSTARTVLDDEDEACRSISSSTVVDPPRALGDRLQGHGHRLPRPGDPRRAQFDTPGQFVWHCHIVEHEDNEMMRPFRIGPVQPGQPGSM